MSSSTSAKSSSEEAEAPKGVDNAADPKTAQSGTADAGQAAASKEKAGLNGAASSADEKPEDGAGPSAQGQAGASQASTPSADEKQDAGHAGEEAGATAEKPAASARSGSPESPDSDKNTKTDAAPASEAKSHDSEKPATDPDHVEAQADATDQAARQDAPADSDHADPETVEDEEEDTLDLRALFASSEPDFASPTDTFELARGAKSAHRDPQPAKSAAHADADIYDREPPPDLPPLDVTPSEGQSFMARGLHDADASRGASSGISSESSDFETDTNGDPLADAVQSALRSVYGADSSAGDDDFRHESGAHESEGPVLQWAGASAAGQIDEDDPYRPDDEAEANVFAKSQHDTGIDEETTEAVLSYLYEHMGSDSQGRSSEQNDDEPQTDVRPDRAHDNERRGYDQWLDSPASSRSPGPDRVETGNHDGYREDRATAPAYARAEPDQPANLAPASAEAPDFAPPMDLSLDNSEASGKLLGAAGLGLIGGIAVAGVAAVFVFNSFVTQQEQSAGVERTQARLSDSAPSSSSPAALATAPESQQKDVSRLGTPEDTRTIVDAPARTAAIVTPDSAPATSAQPPASRAPTPASSETAVEPRIDANDVTGRADQSIPLDFTVAQSDEESFLRIAGLPEGVRLSAGVDTGNGSWLLSSNRASDLSLSVPQTYEGNFLLEAQVLASDARTPISDRVVFQVSVAGAPAETPTTALAPDTARAVAEQPPSIVDRARSLMSSGDVLAARDILRPEAENGNARAALALGQTFDPMTFNPDSPANAGPDATEAFRWYQKAVELGAPEGEKRIADLKSWLLQ